MRTRVDRDEKHWRDRAANMRAMADHMMHDLQARILMLDLYLAERYTATVALVALGQPWAERWGCWTFSS